MIFSAYLVNTSGHIVIAAVSHAVGGMPLIERAQTIRIQPYPSYS